MQKDEGRFCSLVENAVSIHNAHLSWPFFVVVDKRGRKIHLMTAPLKAFSS